MFLDFCGKGTPGKARPQSGNYTKDIFGKANTEFPEPHLRNLPDARLAVGLDTLGAMVTTAFAALPAPGSVFTAGDSVDRHRIVPDSRAVPIHDLQHILAVGLQTPLAGGSRGWRFLVIEDPAGCRELLAAAGTGCGEEPQAVIAVLALEAPWRRRAERLLAEAGRCRDFAAAAVRSSSLNLWLDAQARIATGAMALATRSLGWQARVHTHLDAATVRRALHLPSPLAFVTLVSIQCRSMVRGPAARLSAAAR